MNITSESGGPSPNTVCVARRQRWHPRQWADASLAVRSVGLRGTNGSAEPGGDCDAAFAINLQS
jgi:hypothetical protein